jgi:glycerol uptake facilitator protein
VIGRRVPAWAAGEFIGTFLLVFFGCGSVASALLTESHLDLFEVAAIWGLGVALAIVVSAPLSGAHLNPAVTIAFMAWKKFPKRRVLPYVALQVAGAIAASAVVYALNADALNRFEVRQNIVRGQPGSEASAMVFGEFFPNPGGRPLVQSTLPRSLEIRSCLAEGAGTAVLLLVICSVAEEKAAVRIGPLGPVIIGATITALICLIAPLTMAGFNPARDFGPRLFSSWAGWKGVPFQANGLGWLTVYILSPVAGGWSGAALHTLWLRGMPEAKGDEAYSTTSTGHLGSTARKALP